MKEHDLRVQATELVKHLGVGVREPLFQGFREIAIRLLRQGFQYRSVRARLEGELASRSRHVVQVVDA